MARPFERAQIGSRVRREARSERGELSLRLAQRQARLETSDDRQAAIASLSRRRVGNGERDPDVDDPAEVESLKPLRRDPDDLDRMAIERDGGPDDGGIAAEAALPERRADDANRRRRRRHVSLDNRAPEERRGANHVEVAGGDARDTDARGVVADADGRHRRAVFGGQRREGGRIGLDGFEIGIGRAAVGAAAEIAGVDVDQPAAARGNARRLAQQQSVHEAEDRRRRAHAKRQGHDRHGRPAGRAKQRPEPVPEILEQCLH